MDRSYYLNLNQQFQDSKLIDQNDFKAAVKSADKKIVASQDALDKHVQLLNWIIIDENKKPQEITKIFNLCSPAILQLQNILNKKKVVLDTLKQTDENDHGLVY
uniref:Uncharacterized protein n=1 Tax=Panagrolaimus sp. PS1159 TaxID=55785 RepID=A0AC35F6U5_9BILA